MDLESPARGARPDAPTGGRLVIKKGADREVEFRTHHRPQVPQGPTRPSQKPKRRCLFCNRPLLYVAAPLVLVVVFVLRGQREGAARETGTLAGYTVALVARAADNGAAVGVVIRPSTSILWLFSRVGPAPAGSPVAVSVSAPFTDGSPQMLFGETPAKGDPDTILVARMAPGEDRQAAPGATVRAVVAIAGKTLTLETRVREEAAPK